MKRILVAHDGSPSAERALRVAAGLAADRHAELTILAVMEASADKDLKKFGRIEHATIGDLLEQEASAILMRAKTTAMELGVREIKILAKYGDAAEIILDVAKELSPDTIIASKRGRGRLQGLLLGSVSQKLASLAQCPVMIVP